MNERRKHFITGMLPILLMLICMGGCSSKEGSNSDMSITTPAVTEAAASEVTLTTVPDAEAVASPTAEPAAASSSAAALTPTSAADLVSVVLQNTEDITQFFSYDDAKPFNAEEITEEVLPSGITVREITYDAYDKSVNTSGKISVYVVMPGGDGPFPCILYFHWLGHFNSNKEEFLEEAKEMAGQGIAGVLIDGFFPWKAAPSEIEKDMELVRYQVIEVRRALDYIYSLPEIDTEHIGYVGHDYGAMFGTVVSGIDKRVSCYVLMTAMGNFTDWFIEYWPHTDKDGAALDEAGKNEYRSVMSAIDPVNFIKAAAPAKLFFQFADDDVFISKETAEELYEAASEPKEEKTYSAQHELESEETKQDRISWLLDNLK